MLFVSLILSLSQVLKPSFSIHTLTSFSFYFLHLSLLELRHQLSLLCRPCLSIFNSQWNECYPLQTKGTYNYLKLPSFCFYNASLFSNNRKNLFIVTIHIFRHLFWKICPLLKYFFSAESDIYRWQSHQFPFPTPLKAWVKPQRQPLLELFCKKNVLKNFANLFLIELFFNKRDSNTAVSLLNLQNF